MTKQQLEHIIGNAAIGSTVGSLISYKTGLVGGLIGGLFGYQSDPTSDLIHQFDLSAKLPQLDAVMTVGLLPTTPFQSIMVRAAAYFLTKDNPLSPLCDIVSGFVELDDPS